MDESSNDSPFTFQKSRGLGRPLIEFCVYSSFPCVDGSRTRLGRSIDIFIAVVVNVFHAVLDPAFLLTTTFPVLTELKNSSAVSSAFKLRIDRIIVQYRSEDSRSWKELSSLLCSLLQLGCDSPF